MLVTLQAYIDESVDNDWFVLGGHIATAEAWAAFARDWERLLPTHGTLAYTGGYHFKMSEMASNPERMARVPAFYRIMEDSVTCSISVAFQLGDFGRAQSRVQVPGITRIDWGYLRSPYRMAFRVLLDMFHGHRDTVAVAGVGQTEKVDFYFDNQMMDKGTILSSWDMFLDLRPHVRDTYGATPRFEDDKDFLPLQAADFWVWWVRHWNATLGPNPDLGKAEFPGWQPKKARAVLAITANEDEMTADLLKVARRVKGGESAYDAMGVVS